MLHLIIFINYMYVKEKILLMIFSKTVSLKQNNNAKSAIISLLLGEILISIKKMMHPIITDIMKIIQNIDLQIFLFLSFFVSLKSLNHMLKKDTNILI